VNEGDFIYSSNLEEFERRVNQYPERIHNFYFLFTFYIRALQKISNFLNVYDFSTGNKTEDHKTKDLVNELLNSKILCKPTFDESILFQKKENRYVLQQMKHHFRNISTLMNCVACEKCKLWV
jgi:hypothetical protein